MSINRWIKVIDEKHDNRTSTKAIQNLRQGVFVQIYSARQDKTCNEYSYHQQAKAEVNRIGTIGEN